MIRIGVTRRLLVPVGYTAPRTWSQQRMLNIQHGDIVTHKRSKFQAHFAVIEKEEQIKETLNLLCKKNKIAKATHNIFAFRLHDLASGEIVCIKNALNITAIANTLQIQGKNDDGESGAGAKLLEILERENVTNLIVIVTRWYGGVNLGHDRFRLINQCALDLLKEHNI